MLCGFVFLSKILEWAGIDEGVPATTSSSHLLLPDGDPLPAPLIGFVAMGIAVYQLWSPARRSQETVETCATYWHTIDFLWVLIFALLYVMR
jgi:nitric oxide reductase NorE protein